MGNIEVLLKKVGSIVKRYEEEDRKTGRRFNVYSIAGIERDEVKTHSRMIAELLDPKGSHGQGDLFLKLFFEQLGLNLECKNPIVNYEKSYLLKGRVDIEIMLDDHYIIIENKIDAPDQPKQLERYSEIAKNKGKRYTLFYLTKYGESPSKNSLGNIKGGKSSEISDLSIWKKGDENVDLRLISYREDIRNWLEECIKLSVFISNIRDGLTQYLNLIKKITGDTMLATEKQELISILQSEKQFLYDALAINQAFTSPELRGSILLDFFEKLKNNLLNLENTIFSDMNSLPNDLEKFDMNIEKCQKWFKRGKKAKNEWENVGFFLQIQNSSFLLHVEVATEALHYGLIDPNNDSSRIEKLKKTINEHKNWSYKKWGPKWYSNMYRDNISGFQSDTINLLTNDDDIANFTDEIANEINTIVKSLNQSWQS